MCPGAKDRTAKEAAAQQGEVRKGVPLQSVRPISYSPVSQCRTRGRASRSTYLTASACTATSASRFATTAARYCTASFDKACSVKVCLQFILPDRASFSSCLHFTIFVLGFLYVLVCKINVHKRCEKNVANDCGIDKRSMALIMKELGISGDKLSSRGKKVRNCSTALN